MASTLTTQDGRKLTYAEHGDPSGRPVIVMHGTPGSRVGPIPRASRLYLQRIRLITYDRPGYGGSDRRTGRRVVDTRDDVLALADALGIETFAVVGRSGGGPHALACAATMADRVTRVAAIVSFAPFTLMDRSDWYSGMTLSNVREFENAERGLRALEETLTAQAAKMREDPERHLPFDLRDLIRPDRAVMADFGIKGMLLHNFREALRVNAGGWIDDSLSYVCDWGFDPASISIPVRLWAGADDIYAPVSHTRWLGARIPSAVLEVERGRGHFSSLEVLPGILSWLTTA